MSRRNAAEAHNEFRAGKTDAKASEGNQWPNARVLLALVILGVLARFAIAACSWGTSDTLSFNRFAWSIEGKGILETYRADSEFN
ncbi:MAG: hypothetical protein JWN51_1789, partial [Phycisphaerales bacterium]|nr:hypothetical protein [Phycisphaerales bacterium]